MPKSKKINARLKGNNYERKIRSEFEAMGFSECLTSRNASRYADSVEKGDLVSTGPFRIQCKAVEQKPNLHVTLDEMKKDAQLNCIFWKQNYKSELVILKKTDFYRVIAAIGKHEEIFNGDNSSDVGDN